MNGVLPKFWGKKVTWPISTGEQENKAKCLREQRKKKFQGTLTLEQSTPLLPGGQKKGKKDVTGTYLATLSFLFFQSVFMELRQRLNWGMSICYESIDDHIYISLSTESIS